MGKTKKHTPKASGGRAGSASGKMANSVTKMPTGKVAGSGGGSTQAGRNV
jgi:hypothetical protein